MVRSRISLRSSSLFCFSLSNKSTTDCNVRDGSNFNNDSLGNQMVVCKSGIFVRA